LRIILLLSENDESHEVRSWPEAEVPKRVNFTFARLLQKGRFTAKSGTSIREVLNAEAQDTAVQLI
jgi:hypothetical protein